MEVRVQLLSGMSGLKKNSGNGNYPRAEIRATALRAILSAVDLRMLKGRSEQCVVSRSVEIW
jgi:hypothetical protein